MICPMCGGKNCNCMKYMWIIGVVFLLLAWALWTGRWSLEKAFAVVFILIGVKKLAMSFMKK